MIRPFLIDLNLVKLKYHPFMISLDKCSGSCNAANAQKHVFQKNKRHNC